MPRLLVLNPNTTEAVTHQLHARAAEAAPPGGRLESVTARFGAAYIADEPGAAVAAHAALDAYARVVQAAGAPDAVLIGCFGDPGLEALRALATEPVHGLAEAAMTEASRRGRFAVVTGGVHWPPMLRRLVVSLGLDTALAGIVAIDRTGGQLAAAPDDAVRLLVRACEDARERFRPDVLVLGGAALTAFAPAVSAAVPLPLLDSVEVAMRTAWRAAQRPPSDPSPVAGVDGASAWSGLSPELLSLLSSRPPPAGS